MIGMMYLVLTALLALNVSKEIINAFVTIDESLEVTVKNLAGKNTQAYAAFQKQLEQDRKKTEPLYNKAIKIRGLAENLDKYLQGLKENLIRTTDKMEANAKMVPLRDMLQKDNYDVPTNIMCGDQNDGRGHKATEMKNKLVQFKKDVLSSLDASEQAQFSGRLDQLFKTSDPSAKEVEDGKKNMGNGKLLSYSNSCYCCINYENTIGY